MNRAPDFNAKEKFDQILRKMAFVTESIAQNPEILEFEDAKLGFQHIMYDIERELKDLSIECEEIDRKILLTQ